MKTLTFSILILFYITACQTHLPIVGVDDVDTPCPENIESIELADIDYLLYANKMIDSMVENNNVKQETINSRMRLSISPITQSHSDINMSTLNTAIKNRVLRSGLFIIVSDRSVTNFNLSGEFKEVVQQSSSCSQSYDEFSLQLKNIKNGSTLWSELKQFR